MKNLISVFCSLTVSSSTIASVTAFKTNNTANAQDQTSLDSEVEELKEDLAIEVLKNGIDGSHLTTNNTVGYALDEIQETILVDFPEASEIILPEDQSQNLLKPGNNNFTIGIQDSHADITKFNAVVRDVQTINFTTDEEKQASHDEIRSAQLIKQKFEHGLDASHLYGWNTIYDALKFFQN